jgi:hypothetical protein
MFAEVGDHLVVHSVKLARPVREGEILEVHGDGGAPPYLVRWGDTGHEALVFPGSDASVEHLVRKADARKPA